MLKLIPILILLSGCYYPIYDPYGYYNTPYMKYEVGPDFSYDNRGNMTVGNIYYGADGTVCQTVGPPGFAMTVCN